MRTRSDWRIQPLRRNFRGGTVITLGRPVLTSRRRPSVDWRPRVSPGRAPLARKSTRRRLERVKKWVYDLGTNATEALRHVRQRPGSAYG